MTPKRYARQEGRVDTSETSAFGKSLLVIEDDPQLAATLRQWLEGAGYWVWHAASGSEAERILMRVEPDLILLDLLLPDIDGLLLCSALKRQTEAPIIIATARRGVIDRVLGLKLGADDFLLKPLDLEELLARAEAVLRRAAGQSRIAQRDQLQVGELTIEPGVKKVMVAGRLLQLTPLQYRMLLTLASRPGEIVSRQALAMLLWDSDRPGVLEHAVEIQVSRLRQALERGPQPAPNIMTLRGRGYTLQMRSSASMEQRLSATSEPLAEGGA